MEIIVEKIYQTPVTPVTEVAYLIKFYGTENINSDNELLFND